MGRVVSFKSLLLLLMIIVIGLTLILIVRCTSSPSPLSSQALKGGPSYGAHGNYKADAEGGFSYYQSVNEEERRPSQDISKKISSQSYSKLPSFSSKSKKNREVASPAKEQGVSRLDYPFEEDFDVGGRGGNNHGGRNAAQEGVEENDDDFEGYGGPPLKRDKMRSKNGGSGSYNQQGGGDVVDITCDINHGKYKIGCKKDSSSQVYVPFSFLAKYFEIYGKLEDVKEGEKEQTFTWLHSQAKIYRPKSPYNPKGVFTYFENYNVEVRDRVKCISGPEGVPVSTQWDINGYFYPIQIAQFGLSHFSKYLTEGEPKRLILEDGDEVRGGWLPSELITTLPNDNNDPTTNHYVQVQTSDNAGESSAKLSISPTKPRMLVLSWQMRVISNLERPNITLTATLRYESQVFHLHYTTAEFLIQAKDNHIYHGLGFKSQKSWQHLIRDLGVDVQKGVSLLYQNSKKSKIPKIIKSKLQLESISISSGFSETLILLDNMTLSTNEHLAQFFQAADWFVSHQDPRGGWPIPVRRKFAADFYPVLESGWYSAMGQGHALSLLSRAYSITTNNSQYAEACAKALATIFDRPGTQHGVRALFMDKFIWYEEYPTTPSSFVLNGFMYALLGLYDVKAIEVIGASDKARELYDLGLISLKTMLPLYDTGSGTMYDLRHVSVPGISPNLARLDYHVTHINQLLTFATFEKDSIFESTAERWVGYTEGNRAPHN